MLGPFPTTHHSFVDVYPEPFLITSGTIWDHKSCQWFFLPDFSRKYDRAQRTSVWSVTRRIASKQWARKRPGDAHMAVFIQNHWRQLRRRWSLVPAIGPFYSARTVSSPSLACQALDKKSWWQAKSLLASVVLAQRGWLQAHQVGSHVCITGWFGFSHVLDVQMTPMINCDPNKEDCAEESDEKDCEQYDSGDNLTEDTFVGLAGDTWKHKKLFSSQCTFEVITLLQDSALLFFLFFFFQVEGRHDELFLSFKMSMVHFCQVSRCRTSFKFKFCSKSAHFFGALFQSDLAPCFNSSQRPCSSTYVRIDIYIYIHRYIHTNSNVFIYICRSTHVYIHLHFCVRCPTHVYSHTYTRLVTNTHQGEGVKNRVFTK